MVNGFNVLAFIHFNHVAYTGGHVYNDVWIDCRHDSKFAARCGADGAGDEEAMTAILLIGWLRSWKELF